MKKSKSYPRCDFSPVFPTIILRFHEDEEGNSLVTFEEEDISSSVCSKGRFLDWSLDSLKMAGINPAFPVSTGFSCRIDGNKALHLAIEEVNNFLDNNEKDEKDEKDEKAV